MKTPIAKIFLLTLAFCLTYVPIWAQDEDVMFQAFDWNVQNQPPGQTWYDVVTQNRNIISNAGIDVIWMPPPSNSAAPQGYLPRELYDVNSAYGTETQLRNLISQYHQLDVKVLSDIVINHRVGSPDAVTFVNPDWPTFYITADDEGRDFVSYPVEFSINPDYFPGTALKADGSSGGFAAARDLDHRNPAVRAEIIQWMLFLKNDIGFDGWRYDFVHGYDPIYNKEYNDATNPYFAVGELLESSRVQTNNWVNFTQQSSSAFDFNTKVSLQNALRDNNLSYLRDGNGRPSGMIGVNPSKSVTFLDNHDTGEAQQCCGSNFVFPGGETNLRKGYAYILTHPGNPMVFWTHFFDAGLGVRNAIVDLIDIRKSVRVHAGSTINIAEARNDLYAAYIDGRSGTVAMKLGSGNWSPNGSGWVLRTSGNDYAVWTQGSGPVVTVPPFTVNFLKPSGWGSNINAYFFDAASNSVLPGINAWPGQSMANLTGSEWYAYTVTPPSGVNASDIRVIFNDGTQQTGDLSRSTDGWYSDSAWSDNCLQNCPGTSSNQVTLNLLPPGSGWGSASNIYLYNKATNSVLAGTSGWPGASMSNISGSSWNTFTFTIPNGVSGNDIGVVFNNGSGQQTEDLTRGTDGWFRITGTSSGQSTGVWSNNCTTACPSGSSSARTGTFADDIPIDDRKELNEISFFPNPMTNQSVLAIKTAEAGMLRVTVTNLQGQTDVIYDQQTSAGNHRISVSEAVLGAKGMYLTHVYLNGERIGKLKMLMK
ncbi:starch-binding protein [Fulvivirga sp. M361]|uniref:starch-binding protein n=1 Tax=Fulvivirga sp. M361 TaxID=2594266 RepID=UPI00117A3AFF|nr:starch-binding protein [Fulvivirga sp. M361]TRX49697.1 starch-binding protein [Fulvivirga sp. M361]